MTPPKKHVAQTKSYFWKFPDWIIS
jgi:hypothetical protein